MFTDENLNRQEAANDDGEAQLRRLFDRATRKRLEINFAGGDDAAVEELTEELAALERQILDTPATGALGRAVKLFTMAANHTGLDRDGRLLPPGELSYDIYGHLVIEDHALIRLLEDAMREAPEIGPLVAPFLAAPLVAGNTRG